MAEKKTRQLSAQILQEDLDAYAGLEGISGYEPANDAYKLNFGTDLKTQMQTKQTDEVQSKAAWEADRDEKVEAEWNFHDWVRNAKLQVKAQFGENSNEVQAVGLKKKSEYKSPKPKKTTE